MAKLGPAVALRQVRTLFGAGAVGGHTDRHLLEQFSTGHREAAEAAFAILVERHGAMVLRVCRGVMGQSHDVHDAFQATFLVLVRKAGSLWVRDSIGPWLHGVALRIARKAKVADARRKTHERRCAELYESATDGTRDDGATLIHEEVERLPWKYRAPVVLCYLEGMTHDAAAHALGWPVGTVRGRLARARDLLRSRLVRRGLAPAAGIWAAMLSTEGASAAQLAESSIQAVMALVAERSAGVAPAAVVALSEGCLRMMSLARLKRVPAVLTLAIAALGLAGMFRNRHEDRPPGAQPAPVLARGAEPKVGAPQADEWPAGIEVNGRVVDHRGEAVVGAEVMLLGTERLTVFARPGPTEGEFLYSLSTNPAVPVHSVKTDDEGWFRLPPATSPTNRVAVVSKHMLLWEVPRKQITTTTNLLITLPQPTALTIHAELPDKPAKAEYFITGRMLERADWESDSVFLREIEMPNPGERVIEPLPPGQYAVERVNYTPQGKGSQLMTTCERRLLRIEAGKKASTAYTRTTGQRVEGRVNGLEGLELRYGVVSISYTGPEEQSTADGKKASLYTGFDVIVVDPDGRFTTPPLPPNRYRFEFSAMLAATPRRDQQLHDLTGTTTVVVTEKDKIGPVEIVAKRQSAPRKEAEADDSKRPRLEVRARDPDGAPIKHFEIQLYNRVTPSLSVAAADDVAALTAQDLKKWTYGDLIVSARDFASTLRELGPVDGLCKIDVTLHRGTRVRLRVRDAAGKPLPPAVMPLPQVYSSDQRINAWFSLTVKDPGVRAGQVELMNFLNVKREPSGDFVFHIRTDQKQPLYFGFNHPGALLHYEKGPVPASELAGGVWDITLPAPASVDVSVQPKRSADGEPLFDVAHFSLLPVLAGHSGSVPGLGSGVIRAPEWKTKLEHLGPGIYDLYLQTTPRGGKSFAGSQEGPADVYRDKQRLELKSGSHVTATFDPPPFNENAWRGQQDATVIVKDVAERALTGEAYRVWYALAHYGRVPVAEGKLADDHRIVLEKIAPSGTSIIGGDYIVEVAGEYVGKFRVKEQPAQQEFQLQMPALAGDIVPDGAASDLTTGQGVPLRDLRARFVFLEFWATWCGPCREPMEHLTALAKRRGEEWQKDVAFVAVSIDEDREQLVRHVREHGQTAVQQLWSPRNGAEPSATASGDFSITGVPTAFLIGRDGRILWKGHPASIDLEAKIEELLSAGRQRTK